MANPPDKNPTPDEQENKKDKPFIKGREEKAEQIRVNKQCFLVRNIESFMQKKAADASLGYANFSCISGPPMDITNELVSIKGLHPMFSLTPAQHAVLQPRIRLFLVRGEKNVEIPFDASLSTGAATGASISDMVRSANYRGSGAGIKSFSYELAGVNPAEADKLITANLSLYFKSIADLFTERASIDGDKFKYSDLINYVKGAVSAKTKKSMKSYITDDSDRYAIRAVLGWSDPPMGHPLFSKEVRNSLTQAKVTLNLQLVNHNIKFNQDGTLELDIEYMASLDHALATASLDVFWLPETKAEDDLQRKIQNIGKTSRELVEQQKKLQKVISKQQVAAQIRNQKEDLEKLQELENRLQEETEKHEKQTKELAHAVENAAEELEQIRRLKRAATYRRIIDLLVGPEEDPSQGMLYSIKVEPSEIGVISNIGVAGSKINAGLTDAKKPDEILNQTKKVDSKKEVSRLKERVKDIAKGATDDGKVDKALLERNRRKKQSLTSKIAGQIGTMTGRITRAWSTKGFVGALGEIKPPKEDGRVEILFFYLGDLVDVLLRILKGDLVIGGDKLPNNRGARETLEKFRILMGPIILTSKDGAAKTIGNIADIPISFDLFENWFIHHVIKPQRTSYSLKRFLKDIMTELMSPALGSNCYDGTRQKGKISTIPIQAPRTAGNNPRIPILSRCGLTHLKSKKGLKLNTELLTTSLRNMDNYLYFYMADHNVADRKVDEADDIKNGIYHLRVGADAGLVKSVEFEKTNIPFLKESRMANDAETKDGFLREKYDANITMAGNTFFSPGQYIYVHPSVPGYRGVGADGSSPNMSKNVPRKFLQAIGFGGYYLITKVDHRISPDYYETELVARWEAFGQPDAQQINHTYNKIPGSVGRCVPKKPESPLSFNIQNAVDILEGEINQEHVEVAQTVLDVGMGTLFTPLGVTRGLRHLDVIDDDSLISQALDDFDQFNQDAIEFYMEGTAENPLVLPPPVVREVFGDGEDDSVDLEGAAPEDPDTSAGDGEGQDD